ncbi:restriction endonuclease subunit S [Pluralibacter gergoviae]
MAKYKAYPEYKDSGVEWLGKIPTHWTTLAIKHVAQLNPSKSCISIEQMKGMCSFIPMEKLKFNSLSLDEIKYVPDVYNGYTYFENEDILIAKVTPCFENKNMVVAHDLHNGIGFGSSEIYVLRCNDTIKNDFLFYRLQEDNFMFIAEGAMTGAGGLKRVPSEVLNNFKFGLPSKKEQSIIVAFLNHETAKIDNLIEKQQQLIELLKEKRQAVISNVVNIRSSERKTKLKNLVNMQTGYPFPSAKFKFSPDNSIALLRGVNVGVDSIKWDDVVYWDVSALDRLNEYLLVAGDIVFGMDRPWISSGTRVSEIKEQDLPCLLLQRVARIRSNIKSYQPFIKLCLSSNEFREYAEIDLTGVSVPHISPEQISNFYVKDIPFDEQINLAKNALEKIRKIKIIQAMSEQTIQILQERRTALISAAVTGKIDVRDWVAPDTHDVEEPQEATA